MTFRVFKHFTMLAVIFLMVIFISQVKTAEHLRLIFGAKTIFEPLGPVAHHIAHQDLLVAAVCDCCRRR